ncbi:unnamed protein product [Phaeothamnion confervicola]
MALGALPSSLTLVGSSISSIIQAAGEPGSVDAPGWVLPVGAILVIGTAALIPVLLKPGDDAAAAMQERDQDKWGKGN